jgi:hypothetical protein
MLAVVLLLWRRPGASTALLAAAAWFKLAPAALLPVWLAPLRGRRLAAALGAIVAVSAAMVGVLLALGGWPGAVAMTHALAFQFSRDSPMSIWTSPVAHGLQPLVQAAVLGLIATAAVMLWRRPALAGERPRMAALAAAILIGLQLSADYWTFLYIAWVLPLLSLSLLSGAVVGPEPAIETTPAAAPRSTAAAPA